MKKILKIFFIILIVLIVIILVDTIQAKVFNNRPILKTTKYYNDRHVYQMDTGILVYTYILNDNTQETVFKWESYAPRFDPIIENEIIENNNTNETSDVEFVRTYNVISNLNMTDTTGKYNFYVVQQFQLLEPIVIKVDKKYSLEENANYEFTFKGKKIEEKEYTIQDIFSTFDIIDVEKTDKIGLYQRQDTI